MFENLWYNNEWGYSKKLVDLIVYMANVDQGASQSVEKAASAKA